MGEVANKVSAGLCEPFEPTELEWRIQKAGNSGDGAWLLVVPYVTSRAVDERLDSVFGVMGWGNEFKNEGNGNYLCGITATFDGISVTKWDGSDATKIEAFKGALSGAQKRASVRFGIGRYLYSLESFFVSGKVIASRGKGKKHLNIDSVKLDGKNGKSKWVEWESPELPKWAMPKIKLNELMSDLNSCENIKDLHEVFIGIYRYCNTFGHKDELKSATVIKDKLKEELIKNAEDGIASANKKVSDWVLEKVSDYGSGAESESVLNHSHEIIKQELMILCAQLSVDYSPHIEALKSEFIKLKEFIK